LIFRVWLYYWISRVEIRLAGFYLTAKNRLVRGFFYVLWWFFSNAGEFIARHTKYKIT